MGLRCWNQSAGFSIKLSPLDWQSLQQFLPFTDTKLGGENFAKIKQLLISYMGSQPQVFFYLSLKQNENKGTHLNKTFALGWNSWIVGNKTDSVRLRLN